MGGWSYHPLERMKSQYTTDNCNCLGELCLLALFFLLKEVTCIKYSVQKMPTKILFLSFSFDYLNVYSVLRFLSVMLHSVKQGSFSSLVFLISWFTDIFGSRLLVLTDNSSHLLGRTCSEQAENCKFLCLTLIE